jgi:chromosome partitioning protein
MRRISILNQKGGCGKTSITLAVASALGVAGKKVLIVDCDPQGNASASMGIDPSKFSTGDVLMKQCSAMDAIQPTAWKNVSAIAANRDLATVALKLEAQVGRETRLSKALQNIEGFDFLFIDPPPTLTLLSISALVSVQWVFTPVTPCIFGVHGIGKVRQTIDEVRDALGADVSFAGVILNRWDKTKLSRDIAAELAKELPGMIFGPIPASVKISEANDRGIPAIVHAGDSNLSTSIIKLSKGIDQWTINQAAA